MLSQAEADRLIKIEKRREKNDNYNFPAKGEYLTIPIISVDRRDTFIIDVCRHRIRLMKCTYQERFKGNIILIRLDINGPPHINPEVATVPFSYLNDYNGVRLDCSHLHIYIENFADKWAIPVPEDKFPRIDSLYDTIYDFFNFCNITEIPNVRKGLFV